MTGCRCFSGIFIGVRWEHLAQDDLWANGMDFSQIMLNGY